MKFELYRNRKTRRRITFEYIELAFLMCIWILSFFVIVFAYIESAVEVVEFIALVIGMAVVLGWIISTFVHVVLSQFPYVILKDDYIAIQNNLHPLYPVTRKLKYEEIDELYQNAFSSQEAQKRNLVIKVGEADEVHTVAFRIKTEIYLISVIEPKQFQQELAKCIQIYKDCSFS